MANLDDYLDLLFGYAVARQNNLRANSTKLAHYTSAEAALAILDNRTIRLRNATVMNDHSEIQHGHEIVSAALGMSAGGRLQRVLKAIDPTMELGWSQLGQLSSQQKSRIFMTSLSEHEADDRLGRLSMWRAYGGPIAGVALIFNTQIIDNPTVQLNTVASPVLYGGLDEFLREFDTFIDRLESNAALVRSIPSNIRGFALVKAIQFAIMSIKHVGFKEELEWRLIHQPFDEGNAWVRDKIVSVRGVPQLIYELPLDNVHQGMNVSALTLDKLLYRVIIGPSLYPETVWRAFVDKLRQCRVSQPEAKVIISDIPLRQWG